MDCINAGELEGIGNIEEPILELIAADVGGPLEGHSTLAVGVPVDDVMSLGDQEPDEGDTPFGTGPADDEKISLEADKLENKGTALVEGW